MSMAGAHEGDEAAGAVGFLLVHGGAATGRWWDRLVPLLPGPALAVDLPGRGDRPADLGTVTVPGGAASVAADFAASPLGDLPSIVLVAHSSGGLFVPAIVDAVGRDRVRAMVFHAASVPPEGGNGLDCMQERHRAGVTAAIESGLTATTWVPPTDAMRSSSGEELTDEQLAFVTDPARLVADSFAVYLEPVHYSRAAGIPVTYVVSTRDRAVPPSLQREMAARLPGPTEIVEIDAGHLLAITHPEILVDSIIASAVGTT